MDTTTREKIIGTVPNGLPKVLAELMETPRGERRQFAVAVRAAMRNLGSFRVKLEAVDFMETAKRSGTPPNWRRFAAWLWELRNH